VYSWGMNKTQTTYSPEMKRTARMMAKLRKQREEREAANQAASTDPWQRFCDGITEVWREQAKLRAGLR
jgi:hypothetical protein